MIEIFRKHFEYTAWATARLLDAAGQLSPEERDRDFGTADKSIAGTLIHVYRADRLWLARLKDPMNAPLFADARHTWEFVVNDWPRLYSEWLAWMDLKGADELAREHDYRDLRGAERRNHIWAILLHVVNHATHHRGQVSGFLRALGKTPPALDEILFARENGF